MANRLNQTTEDRNPDTVDIDTWPSGQIVTSLLREDAYAVDAALHCADTLGALVDGAAARIRDGGRIHYFGAGASGRLAMLDATEAVPTFGVSPRLFTAHFPGGIDAFVDSQLDFEDAYDHGRRDASVVTSADAVIGISASGSTRYVRGALEVANETGALTGLVTNNAGAPLESFADITVLPRTGAEAIAGSTRLKAGTATKVLLNAFSTALMVKLGRTYSNLMVELVASNEKLHERALRIVQLATGVDVDGAHAALAEADGSVPVAIVALLTGKTAADSASALTAAGSVRAAADWLCQ